MRKTLLALVAFMSFSTVQAAIVSIDVMIGDNDGFGFGAAVVPDGSPLADISLSSDRRSLGEAAATNGAQQTDFYSAVVASLPSAFEVVFPLSGTLLTGVFEVDMGGFQATAFGPLTVSFNGVLQPNLFNFEDGAFATAVRTFNLDASELANASAEGQFVVSIARDGSIDGIAFDYFRLIGRVDEATAVPEPATFALLGLGLVGLAAARRRIE